MSINILTLSEIYSTADDVGLPNQYLQRSDLEIIAGFTIGSVAIPSLYYGSFLVELHTPFYCKDFELAVSSGLSICYVQFKSKATAGWVDAIVTKSNSIFRVDFNSTLPDHAQLIYQFKCTYINLTQDVSYIYGAQLLTVDYPIGFDYAEFSIAASSQANAPITITNNSVQGAVRDIRVLPIYSGNYAQDAVYMLTASGRDDTDRYHLQRGYRFPEDSGWGMGRLSPSGINYDANGLTLTGTALSGTWTSPVVYIPDTDYISLYLYGDRLSDTAYIGSNYQSIETLVETRASTTCPEPNFLISSWTQRLYTNPGQYETLSLPARRPSFIGYQGPSGPTAAYWMPNMSGRCGNFSVVSPCPFILGRSKRMYIKGDGTVLAEAPTGNDLSAQWEYGHRGYTQGIPYKEYGDINSFWNAGHFISLLGRWSPETGGVCAVGRSSAEANWYRMTFASETDNSNWAEGRAAGDKLVQTLPYAGHFNTYSFGVAQESLWSEPLGSYTMAVNQSPNEWISVACVLYPWGSDTMYMSLYYTHIRNFWAIQSIYLGSYSVGDAPCDEGWAVCASQDGGFWVHVGYMDEIITKYDINANVINTTSVYYDFKDIVETTDPLGLWAIRIDSVYWYQQNNDGSLTETFSIQNDMFSYLQSGGIDNLNNLWLIDRDTSIVYRINFASRGIDYSRAIPYTVALWPHPRDGTAYLYTSFNPDTFSTSVSHIDVNDPYGYMETIAVLPEFPLSEYSGAYIKGKVTQSYMAPAIDDPVWGVNDGMTLGWQEYPNTSLTLPGGDYKQFRITLQRTSPSIPSPVVQKVRIPKSLVLQGVPYLGSSQVYINPHLRYNNSYGHFMADLMVWWPH